MAEARTLGMHLATRLVELGVKDFFAVPGDYNLVLLDQLLKEPRLNMINTCNELSKSSSCANTQADLRRIFDEGPPCRRRLCRGRICQGERGRLRLRNVYGECSQASSGMFIADRYE